jgi:hypothetical protein
MYEYKFNGLKYTKTKKKKLCKIFHCCKKIEKRNALSQDFYFFLNHQK